MAIVINGETIANRDIKIEHIITYCKEHDAVAWLKEVAAQKVEYKVYPRVKVPKVDENGNPILDKKGKPATRSTVDKNAEPKIEMRPISFVQIKAAFLDKFGLAETKKEEASTMYDLIANL